jgi:hypothetical protein
MTVVVVVITFSIIVSYIFISLLLVTVGRPGSNISVVNIISFYGENISFEARLVIYICERSLKNPHNPKVSNLKYRCFGKLLGTNLTTTNRSVYSSLRDA